MAKIDITQTELVWPGKYNEDGMLKEVPRVSLPFQVIETVKSIGGRMGRHSGWLTKEWRCSFITASMSGSEDWIDDVKKLLIYAHAPVYCSASISGAPELARHLRVWNSGNCFKLLPELSSSHPWNE